MDKKKYYKFLFIIGAIHAWLAAGSSYIMSYFGTPAFPYESLIYYQGFMLAVIIFGMGYLIIGLNLDENHGIILMGIVGKLLVFGFYTLYYFQGVIGLIQFIVAISDCFFAILFIEFLINYKKL